MSYIFIWSLFSATIHARPSAVRCWRALLPPHENVLALEQRLRRMDAEPAATRRPWWVGPPSREVRRLAPGIFRELAAESETYGSN